MEVRLALVAIPRNGIGGGWIVRSLAALGISARDSRFAHAVQTPQFFPGKPANGTPGSKDPGIFS